ncbi:MAG: hypothetical protein KGL39_53230 [Patescibacteria group bacterium]|nr:hypothetical protein [Patescibacteria group bacterium]
MANEFGGLGASDQTLYTRLSNKSAQWWNGSAFEAYASGDYSKYPIAMTEQGASGYFIGNFPTAITESGTYTYLVHRQVGASPAEGDPVVQTGSIDWTGNSSISVQAGSMSGSDFYDYILGKGFVRTDKSTQVYEAITDAIQIMRRRFSFDEAEVDKVTTVTIGSLGEYTIPVESDLGLVQSLILLDSSYGIPLRKVSKQTYDGMYPGVSIQQWKGFPKYYCIYAGLIYIGPIPDRTNLSYRVCYSSRAGAITSSSSGVPFTNLYRDVLCSLVLKLLYEGLEEFDKAQYHQQQFEEEFQHAVEREGANSSEGSFSMWPVEF